MYRWFWITCIRLLCYNGNSKMTKLWEIWKYALGSFSDAKTKKYDDIIVIIRSTIFLSYLVTNCFIVSGVIRHWNPPDHVQSMRTR